MRTFCTLLLLSVALSGLASGYAPAEMPHPPQKEGVQYSAPDKDEAGRKEKKLDEAAITEPISDKLQPVKIYCDNALLGLGTMLRLEGEAEGVIITAANLFPKEAAAGVYSFRPFFRDKSRRAITEIAPLKSREAATAQLALCKPGPSNRLAGFCESLPRNASGPGPVAIGEAWPIRSLCSGKEYMIYACLKRQGEIGVVFEFEPIIKGGQGGEGFLDEDGNLIVLDGMVEFSDEIKEAAGLPLNKPLAFGLVVNPKVIKKD